MHLIPVFLALPLFLGALLSDWAYAASFQVQWTNFASWLVSGGLVFLGFALAWGLVHALQRNAAHDRRRWTYFAVLVATFGVGFINALVHSKDAWAAMPEGLWLSTLALLMLLVAVGLGWVRPQRGQAA